MPVPHEAVAELIRQVAAAEIMPRFRALAAGDVVSKATREDPDDIVTVADREAEARLGEGLQKLVPGSAVLGEEAAAAVPSILSRLDDDGPLWVLDPIDGTKNFASGVATFGVMLAFVEHREIEASWIYFPVSGTLFHALRGRGAFENGAPISTRAPTPDSEPPCGAIYTRYAPGGSSLLERAARLRILPQVACAAAEYAALARGDKDFLVYYRLMPWDHAPGVLLLREAGGVARHAGGPEYRPESHDQLTLFAGSEGVWRRVAAELFAPR